MLDDLDDDFEAAAVPDPNAPRTRAVVTPAQFRALASPEVPCGYLVLTLTDGATKRFRIRLERGKFVPGQRTLSIHRKIEPPVDPHAERLEHEWETLAVIGPSGFNVFKRWRNQWEERWAAAIWALLHGRPAETYSLAVEPRCWMTMRELKDDDAKRTGLCKAWRKRFEAR